MRDMNFVEALLRWPVDTLRMMQADKTEKKAADASSELAVVVPAESVLIPVADGTIIHALHARSTAEERLEALIERYMQIAEHEIGCGELPGKNNRGPDIARYCAPHGDGWEWCGGFSGYIVKTAATELKVKMPFTRSLRAKVLADNIAKVGSRFTDPKLARRGDFAVYDRGITGSLSGHIEPISAPLDEFGLLPTIPGNSSPLVCRRRRNLADKKLRFREIVSLRKVVQP